MSHEIKDVLPVVHMPYTDDQQIDYSTLEKQIDYLFETGAHGFCLALVSDLLRLTAAERLDLRHRLHFELGRLVVGAQGVVKRGVQPCEDPAGCQARQAAELVRGVDN